MLVFLHFLGKFPSVRVFLYRNQDATDRAGFCVYLYWLFFIFLYKISVFRMAQNLETLRVVYLLQSHEYFYFITINWGIGFNAGHSCVYLCLADDCFEFPIIETVHRDRYLGLVEHGLLIFFWWTVFLSLEKTRILCKNT